MLLLVIMMCVGTHSRERECDDIVIAICNEKCISIDVCIVPIPSRIILSSQFSTRILSLSVLVFRTANRQWEIVGKSKW